MSNLRILTKYAICASAVCCLMLSNISYAVDSNLSVQKAIINERQKEFKNLNNYTNEYINLAVEISNLQSNINENTESIENLNKALNAAKKLYGENSVETGNIYSNLFWMYNKINNVKGEKESLEAINKIYTANPNSKELKKLYYQTAANFYNKYQQSYQASQALEELYKMTDAKDFGTKQVLLEQLFMTKIALKDYKSAEKYIAQIKKLLPPPGKENITLYTNYYRMLISYKLELNKFKEAIEIYKKAYSDLNGNSEEVIQNKIALNSSILQCYLQASDFNKAKSLIQENEKLMALVNNSNSKLFNELSLNTDKYLFSGQFRYFEKQKEYIDKRLKNTKEIFKGSSELAILPLYTDYQVCYNNLGDSGKEQKYIKLILKTIEKYKDYMPIIYADTLCRLSHNVDKETGLQYILTAKEIYKKYYPASSFKFYDIYQALGNIYLRLGDFDTSLNYYKQAENLFLKYRGTDYIDLAWLYFEIANVYSAKGDINNAILVFEKARQININLFGQNNINANKYIMRKVENYYRYNMNEEVNKCLNQLQNAINKSLIEGKDSDFYFLFYTYSAQQNLKAGKANEALQNVNKASEYIAKPREKNTVEWLYSNIYRMLNKKLKSTKYKIKSNF